MRRTVGVIGSAVLIALGLAVYHVPQAGAAPAGGSPQYVTCTAPETGAKGATGPKGNTGAPGPTGDTGFDFANGPARGAHVRGLIPCNLLTIVCVADTYPGLSGVQGPNGPTGPQGDTGPLFFAGPARAQHVRQVSPCAEFPAECVYTVAGRTGDTGLAGETGPKGATGAPEPGPINGPARSVHRGVNATAGGVLILPNCELPTTGGSTPLLPYALLLVAAGGVVLMVVQRRKRPVA